MSTKDEYQGLGLSEEELAALEGADDEVTQPQATDEDDLDDDDGGDGVDDITTDPAGDGDADPDPAPAAADSEEVEQQPEFAPAVAPVENYEAVIQEMLSKEDELSQQFDDGEITSREYRAQLRELENQRRAVEDQQRDYDRSQELAKQKWAWEVDTFMDSAKENDGVDYRQNKMLNAALDTAVKELAADEANSDKTGKWFLREAHKRVAELFGKGEKAPKPMDPIQKALKDRKPNMEKVPQSLSNVPAADLDTGGDEFSKMDKLTGMDLERALAALTPAQAKAYLER